MKAGGPVLPLVGPSAATTAPAEDLENLAQRTLSGAPGTDVALRTFESQTLQQIAAALSSRRSGGHGSDLDELFEAGGSGEADDEPAVRLTKGSDSTY